MFEIELLKQLPILFLLFVIYFLAFQKLNFLGDSRKKSSKRMHAILALLFVLVTFLFVPPSIFEISLLMIRNLGIVLVAAVIFLVFELLIGFALEEFPRKITWKSIAISLAATALIVSSSGFADLLSQPLSFGPANISSIYLVLIAVLLFLIVVSLIS